MMTVLPPMRLSGAQVLHDGKIQRRSLALARGRITKGPLPEVDLSGYLLLPGIVDLHAALPALPMADTLPGLEARLAREGITTAWITCFAPPPAPRFEGFMDILSARRGGLDLRGKLLMHPATPISTDLLRRLEALGLDFAAFLSETPPEPDALPPVSSDFPRFLCRVAECLDELGILYGSLGDADAEMREYFRMLGARVADQPRTRGAAATARAMNDRVLAPAGDLLPGTPIRDAVSTGHLLGERLCDALVSCGQEGAMNAAAWVIAEGKLSQLPKAWDRVSRIPARIMGLSDRGVFEPGKRADILVVDPATRAVEATIAKGRLLHATERLKSRFRHGTFAPPLAAE